MFLPRFTVLLIVVLCIVYAMASDREPLEKCQSRCDRRYAKHRTDTKGKQRCYERCGDSPAGKKEQQHRGNNGTTTRSGSSVSRFSDKVENRRTIAARGSREKSTVDESEPGRNRDDRKPINRRAGKIRARSLREGSLRIFKSTDGEFRLREIYGDGNCMFRAISFIVWGTESRHRHLRTLVVNHIEESWRELKPFVLAEWSMSSLGEYVGFMGADGTFASEFECLVATRIHRLNLSIYRRADASCNLRRILHCHSSNCSTTANLLFSGRNEYGHYDVLLPHR